MTAETATELNDAMAGDPASTEPGSRQDSPPAGSSSGPARKADPREYAILRELEPNGTNPVLELVSVAVATSQLAAVQAFANENPEFEGVVHAPLAKSLGPSWPLKPETIKRTVVGERQG